MQQYAVTYQSRSTIIKGSSVGDEISLDDGDGFLSGNASKQVVQQARQPNAPLGELLLNDGQPELIVSFAKGKPFCNLVSWTQSQHGELGLEDDAVTAVTAAPF